ncbi:MAG: hypothetical protein V4621_04580 [Pseudomonadota bacterium]
MSHSPARLHSLNGYLEQIGQIQNVFHLHAAERHIRSLPEYMQTIFAVDAAQYCRLAEHYATFVDLAIQQQHDVHDADLLWVGYEMCCAGLVYKADPGIQKAQQDLVMHGTWMMMAGLTEHNAEDQLQKIVELINTARRKGCNKVVPLLTNLAKGVIDLSGASQADQSVMRRKLRAAFADHEDQKTLSLITAHP